MSIFFKKNSAYLEIPYAKWLQIYLYVYVMILVKCFLSIFYYTRLAHNVLREATEMLLTQKYPLHDE